MIVRRDRLSIRYQSLSIDSSIGHYSVVPSADRLDLTGYLQRDSFTSNVESDRAQLGILTGQTGQIVSRFPKTRSVPRHHQHCARRLELARSTDRVDPCHSSPCHRSLLSDGHGAPWVRSSRSHSPSQIRSAGVDVALLFVHVAMTMMRADLYYSLPHHTTRITKTEQQCFSLASGFSQPGASQPRHSRTSAGGWWW